MPEEDELKASFAGADKEPKKHRGRPAKIPSEPKQQAKEVPKQPAQENTPVDDGKQLIEFAGKLPREYAHWVRAIIMPDYIWLVPLDPQNSSRVTLMLDKNAESMLLQIAEDIKKARNQK